MSEFVEQSYELKDSELFVEEAVSKMEKENYGRRLWQKDPTLWKEESDHRKIIENSLGWLAVADEILARTTELRAFASEVQQAGFQNLVLLGMGGSSLCPEVFRRSFGRIAGYPELFVLDSTDPDTIRTLESQIDPARSLFIVASKSGTTTEPLMFYEYFFDRASRVHGDRAGEAFVAITDPGSLLEKIANEKKFRRTFLNWSDIGGRYSALSYFGMVPAALMGLDVDRMLHEAVETARECGDNIPLSKNPGTTLGAILGVLAKAGRDKVTFFIPPPIDSLGLWIEQLIAESTGKEGRGILPVAGEPQGRPDVYSADRLFVSISLKDSTDSSVEEHLRALEKAGHPVVRHVLSSKLSLAAEFFLWEIAIAVAGALLHIDAFDQPNVQESKDNTKSLLAHYKKEGKLPEQPVAWSGDGIRVFCDEENLQILRGKASLRDCVQTHVQRIQPGDYFALTAYIEETREHDHLLEKIRVEVRNHWKVATTVGYGPRFLHSTGQLHKGGPDNGVFIQITAADLHDLQIPGEPQTFGILKQAQALGDFQSLSNRHRRAVRFDCGDNISRGLTKLLEAVHHS
jgi:transaldolase / glucose-6-phosphate isomerase